MSSFGLYPISELENTNVFKVYILKSVEDIVGPLSEKKYLDLLTRKVDLGKSVVFIDEIGSAFVLPEKKALSYYKAREYFRNKGYEVATLIKGEKVAEVAVYAVDEEAVYDFTEGLILSTYKFDKYKTGPKDSPKYQLYLDQLSKAKVTALQHILEAVFLCRDWVNEPVIHLTAEQFAEEIFDVCSELPYTKVEVMNKQKIEALKMGGLLAINKGAPNPPTFTIVEYRHPEATNVKPIALVGKGVVYDTEGLSLKETAGSMDIMKCDMAGAAAVVSTIVALAKNEVPLHVMVFVPATENRPDGNAIVPSDIITMYNGKTVEILNTDAEGRIILGDALAYCEKFDPELIIDLATLTGAAIAAIGKEASVFIGTADDELKTRFVSSSFDTHERVVEFPLWEEYEKEIESDVADIKNIGSGTGAGSITAAAFLKHFVTKPWMHLDIAGPAFIKPEASYRGKHASGYGVRLLYDFLSRYQS
ncbi:MAG TPA: leucyl aminopeptidase family protein [Cytophagales bacterium]|nr:leucyl aminopeptidase family protein [Cytophagales bacterium]